MRRYTELTKNTPRNPAEINGFQKANRPPRYYQFERENEVTIKMTDGVNVIVDVSRRSQLQSTRALGYLMKVGDKWIAAVGEQRSQLLPLLKAKDAAKAMHRGDLTCEEPEDVIQG